MFEIDWMAMLKQLASTTACEVCNFLLTMQWSMEDAFKKNVVMKRYTYVMYSNLLSSLTFFTGRVCICFRLEVNTYEKCVNIYQFSCWQNEISKSIFFRSSILLVAWNSIKSKINIIITCTKSGSNCHIMYFI